MSDRTTRGYALTQMRGFIERTYEPSTRERIYAAVPSDTMSLLSRVDPNRWYSWDHNAALCRAIASIGTDEDGVFRELVRCGESIATEATNTFLRFVMKIITPALFAKKVPDFWRRDNRGGVFTVDTSGASEGRLRMTLSGVAGYDHIGAASVGWLTFGMNATGRDVHIEQSGWSLATPGPDRIDYLVTWRS